MSAFTAVYPPGHSNPDPSKPEQKEYVDALFKNRFSCRFFLPKPVDKAIIDEIIDVARFSPSGNNMQPWEKVYCVSGTVKEALAKEMIQAYTETPEAYSAQYQYYPTGPIPPTYAKRRYDFGRVFYAPLHVDHGDLKGRAGVSRRNYEFFQAPVAFIFTINQALTQGSWMDVGYFLQSFTIAARARGLETISQESVANYQLILRQHLPISDNEIVMMGISMGYPDPDKIAEFSAKQPKREVNDIIQYFGM
ncbi:nitroreductase [Mycena floridula]|nr:nitroreductase [Mycena floridula]